jgi:uncharacterized repeat protein (TIGR03803 family)
MTSEMQTSKTRLRTASIALALAIILVPAVVGTRSAEAQTFKVLYAFTGGADGGTPAAGLVRDAQGNLYGTTYLGGASGVGTVFKLESKTGKETVLYSFTGTGGDGANPHASLVWDAADNFYGTTYNGGAYDYGTVFRLNKAGKETVLYSFTGGSDGAYPLAGLVRDAAGNLYGTTVLGGVGCDGVGCGVVFKVAKAGKETVLYSFTGYPDDGAEPWAGLVRDAAGNLYGTTFTGGASNYGTVFKVDETGKETVLYSFMGSGGDGASPFDLGYLLRDAKGDLYGTTNGGGASNYGTVFKLVPNGKETVLCSFTGPYSDGAYPYGGLARDAAGNFYGTAEEGGPSGYGTVFKLGKNGKVTALHSFNYSDGASPVTSLLRDARGNLYGATENGGGSNYGVVFELTP